ncbi:MAG TPA: lipoxygenase family protein [Agitococcus sp.]|nr:lipoxygenase family protein [Agitococcus sp.]
MTSLFHLFPRRHPSLPQNDNTNGQKHRAEQLLNSQDKYQWTETLPNVVGVPMATEVHFSDEPTLEWLLLVSKTGLEIAENFLAVKLDQLDDDESTETQAKLANIHKLLQEIEALQQHNHEPSAIETIIHTTRQLLQQHNISFDGLLKQFKELSQDTDLSGLSPDYLESYQQLFKTIPLPAIAKTFIDDESFARYRVAGPNPMLIQKLTEIPANFAFNNQQYQQVMGQQDNLNLALAESRIYFIDYKELSLLADHTGQSSQGQTKYVYAPMALFAIPQGGKSLVPVAIQCGQDHNQYPLFLQADSKQPLAWWGWQIAKTIVQVAEGNYHELFVHLARTHLVLEAFTVATHRHLAECHPVNILLLPHCEGTLFINNSAANSLIAPNAPIDHIFGAPIALTQQAAGLDRLAFNFSENMLINDLKRRGVANPDCLTDYPYRDDALLIWATIEQWVKNYIDLYYQGSEDVINDSELQAWANSIITDGKIQGFMPINHKDVLIETLTMIIFTASAQHAAVNFPQKPLMTYAPAISGAGWQACPTTQIGHTQADWQKFLPPIEQSFEQLNILYLLGSVHYRPLGDYRSNHFPYLAWFEDDRVTEDNGPLAEFRQALIDVEAIINARNSERISYNFLLPSQIPTSINI